MSEIRRMYFSVKGGTVILQWPADIEGECLEDAAECIQMQLNSIRRGIGERERAAREERLAAHLSEGHQQGDGPA